MIDLQNVDLLFGEQPERGLELIDQGLNREQIREQTGLVLGVKNVNLQIAKGEICILMGLSGSGKSSLLRTINGLNKITRGKVLLQHRGEQVSFFDCDAKNQRDIRQETVSMVFQRFALMPWLSVYDNVAMPLVAQGMSAAKIKPRVLEQLEIVGLSEWARVRPNKLSGGMQQRVGLARSLATQSEILLMDEPFSALDPLIRHQMQQDLLDLQQNIKKTIVFVSHDLDEALRLGNQIVVMKDGEVVQNGGAQSIILNPVNNYVRDFVEHINPVNALQASAVMRLLTDCPSDSKSRLQLSADADYLYDAANRQLCIHTGILQNQQLALTPYQAEQAIQKLPYIVDSHMPLAEVIALRRDSGHAVFVEQDQEIIGVIGERQIYDALLGDFKAN